MKFKKEDQLLDCIKKAVEQRVSTQDTVLLDADGTLWPEDANQILLNYQLKKDTKKFSELLKDYYQKSHRYQLCEMFARKQAGLSLKDLQYQATQALEAEPLHIFPFQKKLLDFLKAQNMKIIIVTASIKALVDVAVKMYELPIHKVLGFQTEIEKDGIVSDRIVKPSPTQQLKGEVFLQHHTAESCFLAGGNTLTDKPLLDLAELAFVVNSANPDHVIYSSEQKMKELANQKNWLLFETAK